MALTDVSCCGPGLKTLKFSKSVNRESKTWLRTVAICTSINRYVPLALTLLAPIIANILRNGR
jgi:hypothetical protein